jgi:hypothetical protein
MNSITTIIQPKNLIQNIPRLDNYDIQSIKEEKEDDYE